MLSPPLVPAALEQLQETKIFTKLNLQSAYNLALLEQGMMALSPTSGLFEYCVMQYGISSVPMGHNFFGYANFRR